jgi:hypothetical protein
MGPLLFMRTFRGLDMIRDHQPTCRSNNIAALSDFLPAAHKLGLDRMQRLLYSRREFDQDRVIRPYVAVGKDDRHDSCFAD